MNTGDKFNMLTVIKYINSSNVLVKCDCGNENTARASRLISGRTKSCGCYRKTILHTVASTHGLSSHPLYTVWRSMKERCYNKNNPNYPRYGGRGITVCEEWRTSFKCFYDDTIIGYKKGLELDRTSNNGDYCKENFRWVTRKENANNKGNNKWFITGDDYLTMSQTADKFNVNYSKLKQLIRNGHEIMSAINKIKTNNNIYV